MTGIEIFVRLAIAYTIGYAIVSVIGYTSGIVIEYDFNFDIICGLSPWIRHWKCHCHLLILWQ